MKIRAISLFAVAVAVGLSAVGCAGETDDADVNLDESLSPQGQSGGGSPHFIASATGPSINGADLVVSFKEAGLSAGTTVTIVSSGSASITYECVNGGNKNPSASNKTTTSGAFTTPGTFTASKNGSLNGSLTTTAPTAAQIGFSCPGGQKVVLVSVTYSNITLTDTTTGASAGPWAELSYTNPNAP